MQAEATETAGATAMSDAAETNGMSQTATAEKARPRRVCEYIKMAGVRCSGGAKLGRPYCFKHDQFARSRGAVNVALLEDEASIALAVSHTVRALADNEIPVANANAMLRGCHVATRLLEYRLRKEMFLAQQRREAAQAGAAAAPVQVVAVEADPVEAVPAQADPVDAAEAVADEAVTDEAAELEALRAMTPRERDAAEVAMTPLEEAPLGGDEGVARVGSMDGAVYEPAEGEDAVPQGARPAEDCYEKWKPRFHGLKETWEKGLVRPRVALLDSKMGKVKDMPKYRYPAPEPGPRMPAEPRSGPVGEEYERGMAAARLQPVETERSEAERSEAAGPEGGELAVVQACAAGGVWVERAESEGVPPGRVLRGTCAAIATETGVHERFGASATVRDPECDRSLEVGRVSGTYLRR